MFIDRLLRNLIIAEVAILLCFGCSFVRTHVHTYAGLNAGIVVDSPAGNSCAGIEIKGQPGIYAYSDCRGL